MWGFFIPFLPAQSVTCVTYNKLIISFLKTDICHKMGISPWALLC